MHMSLASLPAELIEQIASYLDLLTCRALRLTSSTYRTQTLRNFKHRFFTTEHIHWTQSSLQRLVDVSTHPDFGNALLYLVIDTTPHYALSLWRMRRRSSDAGHLTPITDDEEGGKLTVRLKHEFAKLQDEANELAKWFNETRFDVKCLTTVFKHSTQLESITFSYQGMESRYAKFTAKYCEASQHEMCRPFISTLSAVAASGVGIRRIKMHDGERYGAVSIGRLESLAPSLRSFEAAFEGLETLQLNLRDWRSPDTGFEIERTRAPFVVRFLAKCRNVRVLELSCYSVLEENVFIEMARTCRFEKLQRCKLSLFKMINANDLIEFLGPCSDTLRELQLQHFLMADPQSTWAEVLTSLADSTSCLAGLQSLLVTRLFTHRAFNTIKRVLFNDCNRPTDSLLVEGVNWRVELKDRGHRYMEFEAARTWEASATMYPFIRLDSYAGLA